MSLQIDCKIKGLYFKPQKGYTFRRLWTEYKTTNNIWWEHLDNKTKQWSSVPPKLHDQLEKSYRNNKEEQLTIEVEDLLKYFK